MPRSANLLDLLQRARTEKQSEKRLKLYEEALEEARDIIIKQDGHVEDLKAELTLTEFALLDALKGTTTTTSGSTDGPVPQGTGGEDEERPIYEAPQAVRNDESDRSGEHTIPGVSSAGRGSCDQHDTDIRSSIAGTSVVRFK